MADLQCDSIFSVVEVNLLMKAENGVSRKDPSKQDDWFCLLCTINLVGKMQYREECF